MPPDDKRAEMTRDERSRDDAGDEIAASSVGVPGSARLDAFLNDLRALAAGAPPAPSAELEAMLDGVAPLAMPAPRARRHRKTIAGAVIMGSIGAGLSGAAAAQDRPASPVRDVRAHVVPDSAPAQGDPVGVGAPRLPEPLRPRLDPGRPAVAPTTPPPTHASDPAPSGEDRERSSDDAVPSQDAERDETPEPELAHETEHDGPPRGSD